MADEIKRLHPGGVDKVLELIGTTTLEDSLRCIKTGGIVCMTGIAGNKWELEHVNPMLLVPAGVYFTSYSGGPAEFMETPLARFAREVEAGRLNIEIGKVLHIDDIVEGHELMESNKAGGKIRVGIRVACSALLGIEDKVTDRDNLIIVGISNTTGAKADAVICEVACEILIIRRQRQILRSALVKVISTMATQL
ncbi:MAG: hypothetical protein Q9157_008908 [Trypethelium eluteriae]